jgi:hypothetical protein
VGKIVIVGKDRHALPGLFGEVGIHLEAGSAVPAGQVMAGVTVAGGDPDAEVEAVIAGDSAGAGPGTVVAGGVAGGAVWEQAARRAVPARSMARNREGASLVSGTRRGG